MTKIYIASSWNNRETVRHVMDMLESREHEITEDWTTHHDPALGDEYSWKDIIGIDKCDVFVMMLSDTKSFGKAFEMGYAYAKNKHIIVVGDENLATSVFFKLTGNVDFRGIEVCHIVFIDEGTLYDNITLLIDYLNSVIIYQ